MGRRSLLMARLCGTSVDADHALAGQDRPRALAIRSEPSRRVRTIREPRGAPRPASAYVACQRVLLRRLAASGAWLWWNYRPDRDQWIRTVHQVTAIALLVVALALVVIAILRRARTGASGIVAAVGMFVTVGAAYVLGRLLAWDALGLHSAVRDVAGVDGALSSAVLVVSIDGREVTPSTYQTWAYSHLVLSGLAVLALVMVWLRCKDRTVAA